MVLPEAPPDRTSEAIRAIGGCKCERAKRSACIFVNCELLDVRDLSVVMVIGSSDIVVRDVRYQDVYILIRKHQCHRMHTGQRTYALQVATRGGANGAAYIILLICLYCFSAVLLSSLFLLRQ